METETNPTVDPRKTDVAARKRIPMSVPRRKLEVSDIPGYHLYWFLDENVPMALQAGYEHVKDDEVTINQQNVGTSREISGNTNLGTHVSIVAGAGGQSLNLMKIKEEYYQEDRKAIEERNAEIIRAIFKEEQVAGSDNVSADDRSKRYVKQALFNRPVNKKA